MMVYAETVFWTDYRYGRVFTADSEIENQSIQINDAGCKFAITSIGEHIYWADENANTIKRANLDGSEILDLFTYSEIESVSVGDIEITETAIFWTQTFGVSHAIYRANLDGTNAVKTNAWSVRAATRIGAKENKIFIPSFKSVWVYDTETDLNHEVIGDLPDSPWQIRYYNDYLYWSYSSGGQLYRAPVEGGLPELVIDIAPSIYDIAFTSERIYLCSTYFLYSCLYDGTDLRESRVVDGFTGSIAASSDVLMPRISIDSNSEIQSLSFSGYLYKSYDLDDWTKVTDETEGSVIMETNQKKIFYRAHATYPSN